ncbi:hypothetical protein GNIT_1574 [Glaciecola nitratireducens FR1064]|uniref:Uncharacterized protein n=1 Tax=Glaciecola nitratireducens (strain JCM 12485 / KCTC 12276 / FR1064) TaxID=1085623 RepID=G4QGQ5_GLANF|nr:hypothetical protein GNIT_1574 [Glaciecola nitratireducens FR1064]
MYIKRTVNRHINNTNNAKLNLFVRSLAQQVANDDLKTNENLK